MILSIIITILCGVFFKLAQKSVGFSLRWKEIQSAYQEALEKPKSISSIYLFCFLFLWILLPLTWGLSFYLQSDANVVVVLFTIFWGYYIIKFLFPISSEE